MLNVDELAKEINKAIDAKDKDGNPDPVTPEQKTYAEAIINTLKAGIVNNLPGTINGVTAAGAPLSAGMGMGGLMTLVPATWLSTMMGGFPTANPGALSLEATGSTTYLMSSGLVNFAAGNITGTCTSTPVAPGPLAAGAGMDGKIAGLAGAPWAAVVMPPTGDPSLSQKIYGAISKYIMEKAAAAYATGTVAGVCPPAAGPLTLGAGLGGTLS